MMPVANRPWGASCSLRSSNHYLKDTTFFAKNPSCQTLEMRPRGRHRCRTCPRCGRAALQSLRSRAHCRPRSGSMFDFQNIKIVQSSHLGRWKANPPHGSSWWRFHHPPVLKAAWKMEQEEEGGQLHHWPHQNHFRFICFRPKSRYVLKEFTKWCLLSWRF